MKTKFKFLATMLIGILLSTNVWGEDPVTKTYTLSNSDNGKSVTTGDVSWNIGSNAIEASSSNMKLTGTITVTLPTGATLTQVSLTKSNTWGGGATVTFASGSTTLNTFSADGSFSLTKNKTDLVYTFTKSGTSSKNAWVKTISVTYTAAAATPVNSLNLYVAGQRSDLKSGKNVGDKYTLPTPAEVTAECGDKVFVGWSSEEIPTEGSEPSSNFYAPGAEVTLAANNNFYAVFADTDGGETGYQLVATPEEGKTYIIVSSNAAGSAYALPAMGLATEATTSTAGVAVTVSEVGGNKVVTTENTDLEFTYESADAKWAITASTSNEYLVINGNGIGRVTSNYKAWWDKTNGGLYGSNSGSTKWYDVYLDNENKFKAAENKAGSVFAYEKLNASYSNYTTTCKACESEVTVTKSACENGSFTVSKETVCADDAGGSVTVTCTPDEHYHVSAVTATVGTVTGSGNSYTVSGITAATEITVTFAIDQQITVTWNVNGTATPQILWPGEHVTALPEAPTVMPTCANTFMGWSTETLVGEGHNAPTDLFNKIEDLPEITADITFNAVFAMAVGGGQDAKYSKLTDVSVLEAGDKIVITGVKNETLYGMKAYVDPANNCLATDNAVTLDGDGNISTLSGACELTLGGSAGAWTLFDGTYYLYAAGTATSKTNYMKGKTTADDACLWTIAYNSTIECNDVTSVNNDKTPCLRHNNDGLNNIFSCYTSGNAMGVIVLYRKPGTTYSNYVTTCATYTVTWMSNGFEIRKDENVAPGTELTAPTLAEIKAKAAACNDHLVGWMPAASTMNPKVKQDTAPAEMVGQQVTVTDNVVYHAVYADVAGE